MIVIDDRETELIKRFIELKIPHKIERLHIADVHLSSRLVVELKRIFYNDNGEVVNDMKASFIDSRYREQSENRRDIYERNAVIVQISVKDYDLFNKSFTQKKFMGFVISVQHRYKSMFFLTDNQDETINVMLELYLREKDDKISDPVNRLPRPKSPYYRQRYFLNGLIGCGDKITKDLLNVFKKPVNVIAGILNGDLIKMKGIGKKFIKNNQDLLLKEEEKEEKKDGEKNE